MVLDTLVTLCDYIFWTLQLMDVELVPWETAKIGIYKDVLKYCGDKSSWTTETCY